MTPILDLDAVIIDGADAGPMATWVLSGYS